MALYEITCKECSKKIYLNMQDVREYIKTGRINICPECKNKNANKDKAPA